MNRISPRLLSPSVQRLLLGALLALPAMDACSSSSSNEPAAPITFSIEVTSLDGLSPDQPLALRCDHTLAVGVSISTTPVNNFVLRPAHACGTSTRCGYVHLEALAADDTLLASADSATPEGVLELGAEQAAQLSTIRASLIRGFDLEPLQNPDKTQVAKVVTPEIVMPSDCVVGAGGAAGAGGEGSLPNLGGAGGESAAPMAGGAGGESPIPAAGGAAGADTTAAGAGGI
jgi:hypothetical protein